jgi:lipopolysaccharide transport system permease protein
MPVSKYKTDISELFSSLIKNRQLIIHMTKREIAQRYRGTLFGITWSFLQPLIMLLVYTFVFHTVFKAKWGTTSNDQAEFAVILFCGLIIYNIFAECISRAPQLILNNISYVKKIIFPLEVLPWVVAAASLFNALTSFIVLIIIFLAINLTLHWTIIFLPLIIIPYIFLITGICWFLSSIGVFMRDIGQIIAIFISVFLFLTPVFYPLTAVPPKMQYAMKMNPLTYFIEEARNVVLWGGMPDWLNLAIYSAVSLVVAWLGFYWFQRTRKGFADVI